MIVVADTTPLNYLILIGEIDLLRVLYRTVLIPLAVHRELQHPRTPPKVRNWAAALPNWCEVRSIVLPGEGALSQLDAGEREAIQLALDTGIDTVLIDESEGRQAALRLHLKVTGTVAILEEAAQLDLIDFPTALEQLEKTNFRLSSAIRQLFLKRNV